MRKRKKRRFWNKNGSILQEEKESFAIGLEVF